MKLIVKTDYSNALVFPVESAGAIVTAFMTGEHAQQVYKNGKNHWEMKAADPLEVQLVAESEFAPMPEPLEKLAKTAEDASARWLDEYNRRTKAEAKVKELEDKLAALKTAVSEEPL